MEPAPFPGNAWNENRDAEPPVADIAVLDGCGGQQIDYTCVVAFLCRAVVQDVCLWAVVQEGHVGPVGSVACVTRDPRTTQPVFARPLE